MSINLENQIGKIKDYYSNEEGSIKLYWNKGSNFMYSDVSTVLGTTNKNYAGDSSFNNAGSCHAFAEYVMCLATGHNLSIRTTGFSAIGSPWITYHDFSGDDSEYEKSISVLRATNALRIGDFVRINSETNTNRYQHTAVVTSIDNGVVKLLQTTNIEKDADGKTIINNAIVNAVFDNGRKYSFSGTTEKVVTTVTDILTHASYIVRLSDDAIIPECKVELLNSDDVKVEEITEVKNSLFFSLPDAAQYYSGTVGAGYEVVWGSGDKKYKNGVPLPANTTSLTLKPVLAPKPITVNFDVNSAMADITVSLTEGNETRTVPARGSYTHKYDYDLLTQTYAELPKPTCASGTYTFTGWYTESTCDGTSISENDDGSTTPKIGTSGPITLYAGWAANRITVTYNYNYNGCPASAKRNPTVGNVTVANDVAVERTGYTLDGWKYDGTVYIPGQSIPNVTGNITLYAQWTPKEYTVNYSIDNGLPDGAVITMSESSRTVKYDSKINNVYKNGSWQTAGLPTPDGKGKYNFEGWYLNPACTGNNVTDSTMVNVSDIPAFADGDVSSITLYAKWKYTVTYALNEGAWSEEGYDPDGAYDAIFTASVVATVPVYEGHHFKGWKVNEGSVIQYPGQALKTVQNTTLTACWEEMVSVITYDTGCEIDFEDSIIPYSSTENGRIPAPSINYPGGIHCGEWTIKHGDGTVYNSAYGDYLPEFKSYVLVAHDLRRDTYPVTYSYDLGLTPPADGEPIDNSDVLTIDEKQYGIPYYIQQAVPEQYYGHNFLYWQDEDGNKYAPGEKVEANRALKLTAQWVGGCYVVLFDTGVATDDEFPASDVPLAQTYPLLRDENGVLLTDDPGVTLSSDIPTRLGYTFTGWKLKEAKYGDTSTVYQSGTVFKIDNAYTAFDPMVTNTVILQAQWEPIPVWVNFCDIFDPTMMSIEDRTVQYCGTYGTVLDVSGEKAYVPFPTFEDQTYSVFLGWTDGEREVTENTVVNTISDHPLMPFFTETSPYVDVYVNDDGTFSDGVFTEALKAIAWCKYKGYMTGTVETDGNTYFHPDDTLTRAQAAVTVYKCMGEPAWGTNGFYDVTEEKGNWYNEAVSWCKDNGIMSGTSASYFKPGDDISRVQFVTALYRLCGLLAPEKQEISCTVSADCSGCSGFASETCVLNGFTDVTADTADYYRAPLAWAVQNGIIGGTSASALSPKSNLTRLQCAIILRRFFNFINA